MIDEIFNRADFLRVINYKISEFDLLIQQDRYNAGLFCNTTNDFLEYYTAKKNDLINAFSDLSYIIRFDFAESININPEDLENLQLYFDFYERRQTIYNQHNANGFLRTLETDDIKSMQDYCTERLKDLENSLKIAYYKHQIELIKAEVIKTAKQDEYFHPIFINQKTESFFMFLLNNWLNNYKKPLRPISTIFQELKTKTIDYNKNDYQIKDITQLDFVNHWNNHFKPLHKYKYHMSDQSKQTHIKTLQKGFAADEKYFTKLNDLKYEFLKK